MGESRVKVLPKLLIQEKKTHKETYYFNVKEIKGLNGGLLPEWRKLPLEAIGNQMTMF